LHPGGRDVEIEVRQEALKSTLSTLSSLSRPELIEGDKEESPELGLRELVEPVEGEGGLTSLLSD